MEGTKVVSISEFVRRIIFLSERFSDYKIKVSTFYHYGINEELTKLNIPFDEYDDPDHNDKCPNDARYMFAIYLNVDKTEILDFSTDIAKEKLFWGSNCHIGINEDTDMLRVIFNELPPKSLVIGNMREFVKDMMNNIFIDQKTLVFHKKTITTKRKYENVVEDNDNKIIKHYYEITEETIEKIILD